MSRGARIGRASFLKGAALMAVAGLAGSGISSRGSHAHTGSPMPDMDSLTHRAYDDLKGFTDWLAREGVRGYIGEVNWPNDLQRNFGDTEQWNALGEKWYQWADAANLWVTMFSVDEQQLWGGYSLNTYTSVGDGDTRAISKPQAQAPIYEAHPSTTDYRRGLHVAGSEYWADSHHNRNLGTYGEDWCYAGQETMEYLKSRGTDIIRLPFRWERIQPALGGNLDPTELQRLKDCVARAGAAGLKVILDLHNYSSYYYGTDQNSAPTMLKIGSSALPAHYFYSLWSWLSWAFKDDPNVLAYELMNEPDLEGGIPSAGYASPQKAWEAYTQWALYYIRYTGDSKLVMVPGYAGTRTWSQGHPVKWISDWANNHMYTAHQYFWVNGWKEGGNYSFSYEDENMAASERGY